MTTASDQASLHHAGLLKPSDLSVRRKRPAVFLDRDGTINVEVDHLSEPGQVVLLPGAAQAIARLNHAGMPVIVVTNQAGVARGLLAEPQVAQIHAKLDALLATEGARIDRYYYCPHHPTAGLGELCTECECRKPNPGMLRRAAEECGLDLAASVMIGDKLLDLEAGARAGCQTILVRTGYGTAQEGQLAQSTHKGTTVANSLWEAVESWLGRSSHA